MTEVRPSYREVNDRSFDAFLRGCTEPAEQTATLSLGLLLNTHTAWAAMHNASYLTPRSLFSELRERGYDVSPQVGRYDHALVAGLKLAPLAPQTTVQTPAAQPMQPQRRDAEEAVRTLIRYFGADPEAAGLRDTPARVVRAYDELRLDADVEIQATAFETQQLDDLVVIRNVAFSSYCQHHLFPYHGTMTLGYLTVQHILGLSKFARIVRKAAAGLTVQEELTRVVAEEIARAAQTDSVAVLAKAVHSCMFSRGARAIGSDTVTSVMLGKFRENPALRTEFMQIATL